MYLNNVTINGNLAGDAQLRKAGDSPVVNFRIANTSPYGEKRTSWFDVSFFGKQAETISTMLTKGTHVVVIGEISERKFGENNERTSLSIRANSVQLVPRGGSGDTSSNNSNVSEDDEDGDVPF